MHPTEVEAQFGYDHLTAKEAHHIQRLADVHKPYQVKSWADEGMPIEAMGTPSEMEAFRERQAERPPEVPKDIERRNNRSIQRSKENATDHSRVGDTQVPDSVRDVISSPGRSLDRSIQRVMEDRMGDSLGDVRIHTGHQASKACDEINARAFTVGNHVAFNTGEYDPDSAEGQHVLAHELAHVRQQTGGAVSMLPQDGLDLEIDPDPSLEREAEETAERVMKGGELGIQRMANTEVHVQRSEKGVLSSLKESVFGDDDSGGLSLEDVGDASGVEKRLYALANNQQKLEAKVEELATKVEGSLSERVRDSGAGEGIKMGATELGKQSGVPFGEVLGSLSGAALQAIYNNREKVKEILGLKGEANLDKEENTGSGDSQGVGASRGDR